MKPIVLVFAVVSFAVADKLPGGPYPPAGWKPQGATLQLPNEYGPPKQQQSNVEITREKVQFVGQVSGQITETTTYPSNEYLPPSDSDVPTTQDVDDTLRVQGLPKNTPPGAFNGQLNQLNTGEFIPFHLQNNAQSFRSNNRQIQQSRIQAGQIQVQSNANAGQLTPPNIQPPQSFYGVPPQSAGSFPDEDSESDDDESNIGEGPAISVSNSVNNGQYYILGPDNTLQKVIYMTSQTEDDRLNNGYTAQLRYSPVEPIRDPVYGFDAQGRLVKILNKK